MKNLIKLWLIAASVATQMVVWAAQSYKFGYFDESKSPAIKVETPAEWLRKGLKHGGVRGAVQISVQPINKDSADALLKDLDFLILRGDLISARTMAERYRGLGGRLVVADEWTREDLAVEGLAVLSLALPVEKRMGPLLTWLSKRPGTQPKGVFLAESISDFDKIWFYEFKKNPLGLKWDLSEVLVEASAKKIDFSAHKNVESLVMLARPSTSLLTVLTASTLSAFVVIACDPWQERPSEAADAYFKKNLITSYMTLYPQGLTEEARDFEKEFKEAKAADALLHDSLVIVGKALAKSEMRVNSRERFYASLEGTSLQGVSGKSKISRGEILREVFVVTQRGDNRVLDWRSGLVK